jgi:hypothetical protein
VSACRVFVGVYRDQVLSRLRARCRARAWGSGRSSRATRTLPHSTPPLSPCGCRSRLSVATPAGCHERARGGTSPSAPRSTAACSRASAAASAC